MTSDEPCVKRSFAAGSHEAESESMKLYSYFRAVGRVADSVPASVHYMGGIPYITTSVGRSFQIFDVIFLIRKL
jgi:hypothetical protein